MPTPHSRSRLAQRIRQYQQARDAPRRTPHAPPPYVYSEIDEMIRLAEMWLPFGGPPEEEIFTRFGLTRHAFQARLEKALTIR
ncbi:hypothetical protein [Nocardia jiangxiensis]|uniref:DUF3263 domain-containing protein n=1 Tax=Nocardia jiangxiensis TaxID=282685 RepID=A0ABW6SB62_9NOCA|nr:hypothetical protein [Nocardia jiangxiensis]